MFKDVRYLFNVEDYPQLSEIDEEVILKSWLYYRHNPENSYARVLDRASFYIKHGLTPAYYSDEAGSMLVVTSKEFIQRKMN
jgi:hypothetical protein